RSRVAKVCAASISADCASFQAKSMPSTNAAVRLDRRPWRESRELVDIEDVTRIFGPTLRQPIGVSADEPSDAVGAWWRLVGLGDRGANLQRHPARIVDRRERRNDRRVRRRGELGESGGEAPDAAVETQREAAEAEASVGGDADQLLLVERSF